MHYHHNTFHRASRPLGRSHAVTIRTKAAGASPSWASAIRHVDVGQTVFHQGDAGNEMYVIRSGTIELHRTVGGCDYLVGMLGPGEFFGELALITRHPRSTTATVCRRAELIAVRDDTFVDMLRDVPDFAARLIKGLATRLEMASEQAEALLLGPARSRIVECLCSLAAREIELGARRDSAVYVPVTLGALAEQAMLPRQQALDVIEEMTTAGLVATASAAGIDGPGYVIAEIALLQNYVRSRADRALRSDTLWVR